MRKEAQSQEPGLSDAELVGRVRAEDAAAFRLLTDRYMSLLQSRASRYSSVAGADPEDFIQEGLLALYRAAKTYDGDRSAFSTYAGACVTNAMTDAIRRIMRLSNQNTDLYLDDMGESLLHKEASPLVRGDSLEDVYAQGEQSRLRMRQIRSRLSVFEQEVLKLYLGGYSYQQISSAAGKSPKAVDNALQRVRRKLRPAGDHQSPSSTA